MPPHGSAGAWSNKERHSDRGSLEDFKQGDRPSGPITRRPITIARFQSIKAEKTTPVAIKDSPRRNGLIPQRPSRCWVARSASCPGNKHQGRAADLDEAVTGRPGHGTDRSGSPGACVMNASATRAKGRRELILGPGHLTFGRGTGSRAERLCPRRRQDRRRANDSLKVSRVGPKHELIS